MPDVLDFQIVNALQLYPRISWVQLSRVINVDASTLSRRWQALIQNRLVWTNCEEADEANAREQTVSALVEIRCTPGMRGDVIAALGRQGPIFSIHCTSGARDLYIMVSMPSLALMDRYIDEHVVVVPGIAGTQTHYFRAIYQEASSWRFAALTAAQATAVERLRPPMAVVEKKPAYQELVASLATDVRRSAADVQQEVGRSISVVSRDLDVLLSADWVRWRIDFAHMGMGFATAAVLWLSVEQAELNRVAVSMKLLPQVRFCASATGEANLAVMMWLRNLRELDEIELRIASVFAKVQITDRWIVPRIAKRDGHILDLDSRRLRFVPNEQLPLFED